MINVLTQYNSESVGAVAYHRLIPLGQLAADNKIKLFQVDKWSTDVDENIGLFYENNIDVVWINRQCPAALIDAVKKSGVKLVVDFDDYWVLPSHHIIYKAWREGREAENCIRNMKAADVVTCATPYLAARVHKYHKKIAVIRNSLNPRHKQWQTPKVQHDVPRFMWAGGTTHQLDVDYLREPCAKLAHSNIPHMIIHGGYRDEPIYRGYAWVLSGGGTNPNFGKLNKADVWNYGQFYDHCDIALAPLRVNEFNRCKSELKAIEAGMKGCAFIGSEDGPYAYIIDKNTGILVRNSPGAWWHAMKKLATNRVLREDKAAGLNWAVNEYYNFDKINELRMEVLNSIVTK